MSHDAPKFKFGFAVDKPGELTRLRDELVQSKTDNERLRAALEYIRQVASGEKQVAYDDTQAMEIIADHVTASLAATPAPVTSGEVAQFMREYDAGLHPLSKEDLDALTQSKPALFECIKRILATPAPVVPKEPPP